MSSIQRIPQLLAVAAILLPLPATADTIDFENIPLAADSHTFPGADASIDVGSASFNHDYEPLYDSWSGWVISNEADLVTPGYLNQFSAWATTGAGQNNYALAYVPVDGWGDAPVVTFSSPVNLESALFANTTYAALAMSEGDPYGFSKPFGGASGDDPDYFLLSITGYDSLGAVTGTVDFYLADFRFEDNSLDYIVSDWTQVDLSSLGTVSRLGFSMDSTDFNQYGVNTPLYFALDKLTTSPVPWPAAPWLYGAGLALFGLVRRRAV
ncbi:MAG: DUF4465 domain-containing protein [Azoarcus sp.]|jgi:hypothetical protein|nr:DUF4465 domain-containing protein [Azoarcus sp.]